MRPYWSLLILIGRDDWLWILMDPFVFVFVFFRPYVF